MRIISILLISVVLIVGLLGCSSSPTEYTLTISSTEGGDSSCVPSIGCTCGEGTESSGGLPVPEECVCTEGTEVSIKATPDPDYRFIGWTGDVETVADVNAATTTVTMNNDYTIIANFTLGTIVQDWYDLDAIRYSPNSPEGFITGDYILMNNLDATTAGYTELVSPTANEGKGWEPIGTELERFTGNFYGKGYEIKDLFINRPDENYVGLFGYVCCGSSVGNIGVVNVDITGGTFVGGLVGLSVGGNMSNSYSTGSVTGRSEVGGLIGENIHGDASECYSVATVTGEFGVGGLLGMHFGNMVNSYAIANVSGVNVTGGLIGIGSDDISYSYFSGNVTGSEEVGGLVGYIHRCNLSNSYSTGSVIGSNRVGGLIGWMTESYIYISYSSGHVTGTGSDVGGLVGDNLGTDTVTNSFWDTETSGQASSDGGTGKTTAEMQDITTFMDTETEGLDDPWDIVEVINSSTRNNSYIWNIADHTTYPFLSFEPVS